MYAYSLKEVAKQGGKIAQYLFYANYDDILFLEISDILVKADFKPEERNSDNKEYSEAIFDSFDTASKYRIMWLKKSAEQGYGKAQYRLALLFFTGKEGIEQNYQKSYFWMRKAAEQGIADAQFGLGFLLYAGKGVTRDTYEAEQWFRKAAAQGNKNAIEILAELS